MGCCENCGNRYICDERYEFYCKENGSIHHQDNKEKTPLEDKDILCKNCGKRYICDERYEFYCKKNNSIHYQDNKSS